MRKSCEEKQERGEKEGENEEERKEEMKLGKNLCRKKYNGFMILENKYQAGQKLNRNRSRRAMRRPYLFKRSNN